MKRFFIAFLLTIFASVMVFRTNTYRKYRRDSNKSGQRPIARSDRLKLNLTNRQIAVGNYRRRRHFCRKPTRTGTLYGYNHRLGV